MPPPTEEGNDTNYVTSSFVIIPAWLKKFHFSGRVIMCSVLFGLGLVLLGSLVFAINMDDDSSKPDSENMSEQIIPTKPPSRYVGPVIMGIGSFIVTVGIIMCLFETNVCRKKSGDASPLIGEKIDPEGQDPHAVAGPSSSRGHKTHKHGAHKTCPSPKKSKCKHVKSNAKGKGQQKNSSPRSPPISIEQSKGFMTSSEDTFLTPPNIPDATLQHGNPIRNETASSLMKSFTSSDPSWNQSTEFLTPSTSFKDTSTSINSSVEVHERQGQVNFKTSEFMTPLTVEEDRIQKLFIRVKDEQKEIAKREMDDKTSDINSTTGFENVISDSSIHQIKTAKENIQINENEEKNIDTGGLPSSAVGDVSCLSNIKPSQSTELKKMDDENKTNREEDDVQDKCFISKVHVENNEVEKEILNMSNDVSATENSSMQDNETQKASSVTDSLSLMVEIKYDQIDHPNKETNDDVATVNDLENSVSSDETIVSLDNCMEKSNKKDDVESTLQESSCINSHPETRTVSESTGDDKSADNSGDIDPSHNPVKETEVETNDKISHGQSDTDVDKLSKLLPTDNSS